MHKPELVFQRAHQEEALAKELAVQAAHDEAILAAAKEKAKNYVSVIKKKVELPELTPASGGRYHRFQNLNGHDEASVAAGKRTRKEFLKSFPWMIQHLR